MAGKTKTILIVNHPILSQIWDAENNTESANDYGIGNGTRDFAWRCPRCKKSFRAKANSVVRTGLCPECAYKEGAKKRIERKLKSGKYISVADDAFLSKYWAKELNSISPDTVTNGANKKYMWYCPQCGTPFERKVSQMKRGTGLCKDCSQKQGTAKHELMMLAGSKAVADVPELMADWDKSNNLLDPTKVSYGSTKTAYWICRQCNRSFPRKTSNQFHSMTHFCEDCAAEFRHEEHRKNMTKYNETVADKPNMIALWDWDKNTRDPYDLSAKSGIRVHWKCKCGETWEEKPCDRYNLLPQCMKCSMRLHNDRKNRRAIEKGGTWGDNHPKLAKQWHPTLNGDVTPYDITPNCCTPYYFLCEYGHAYKAEPRERALHHAGCPICNAGRRTSFAEQAISFYLGKVIEVKSNYPIMSHSELDVFIPELPVSNKQAAIEFDGLYWHSQKRSIDRDARKDKYCRDNGIRLIRVKEALYNEKIDSNLILFDRKGNDYQWLINELCYELDLPVIDVDIIKDTPGILERLNIVDVETSLAKKRPDALAYWNYEANAPMKPEKVGYTSSHVFAWHCPKCGNDFMDSVSAVTGRNHICKECGKILKGINISIAKRKKRNR